MKNITQQESNNATRKEIEMEGNILENFEENKYENGSNQPEQSEQQPSQQPQQPEQQSQPSQQPSGQPQQPEQTRQTVVLTPKKKMPGWVKGLLIFLLVIVCVVILAVSCGRATGNLFGDLVSETDNTVTTGFGYNYIGTIHVEGEISESSSGTYNQQYLLNAIDAMMYDEENKGLILYVDTPGGSVFASDELYLKIKEYQEETGRPVYSSMQSQATSGGYYVSAPSDKIIANRNCWTGSIGVTLGSMMDVSQLLENLGIKTHTITSGANKAMGSSYVEMTEEQEEIFQGLVDEAFDQFVEIVAEGRGMSEKEVRKIADGRIYTAKQALANGLIDAIGTYEDAISDMKESYDLEDCSVEEFLPETSSSLYDLLGLIADGKSLSGITSADAIKELTELNGSFQLSYIASVRK